MGHLVGKDLYREVGRRLDRSSIRAPWSEALHQIVKTAFSEAEADLYVRMPYRLSSLNRIAGVSGIEVDRARPLLERLADKGIVIDTMIGERMHYMPSPMFVGVFEFTMMRMGPDAQPEVFGPLFAEYLEEGTIFGVNCEHGEKVSVLRALPYEDTVEESVEILDYEKASEILESATNFALSYCSCRHEKEHAGGRTCEAPLEVCTTFNRSADYMIRHNMGRQSSKEEIRDNLQRSRDLGLVMSADNVQQGVGFICNCCSCCCNLLLGISRHGYPNNIVTSSFIARSDTDSCKGCGKCSQACPIDAIEMVAPHHSGNGKAKDRRPQIDDDLCIGCGVCALQCNFEAMKLVPRRQKVIHPETTFRRIILQCLERGTLQYQLFDEPENVSHQLMRGVVGGFLKLPPTKRALMSDALRSRFLDALEGHVRRRIGKR